MRKLIFIALCTLLLPFYTPSAYAKSKPQVVYFVPHPDDEVLTFGPTILEDERHGKEVILVLMSAGECSGARMAINKKLHEQKFSKPAFAKLRIADFIKTARAFHVKQYYIHHLVNNHFGYENTRKTMIYYLKKYKNAEFKSMSPVDLHPDHALTGKVLEEFQKERLVSPAKTTYFLSIYTTRFKHVHGPHKSIIFWASKKDVPIMKQAIGIYSTWDPAKHMYATGRLSVRNQFRSISHEMFSTYYKDPVQMQNPAKIMQEKLKSLLTE